MICTSEATKPTSDLLMAKNDSRPVTPCALTISTTSRGQEVAACESSSRDSTSCIPIQRKSSRSLTSMLSSDESSFGLPSLGASETSLSAADSFFLESSCASSSRRQRQKGKRLRWGQLEMRFYPVIPGDHPDTAQGPPITIAWDHFSSVSVDIDAYEASKTRPNRHRDAMRLSWTARRRILMRVGATEDDIYSAVESSHQVQKQRKQTLANLYRRQLVLEIAFTTIRWAKSIFMKET